MIQVIDNVIGQKYSQLVFDVCANLKWTFVPDISYGGQGQGDGTGVPGFSYNLYLDKEYNKSEPVEIKSVEYFMVAPILLEAFDKAGLNLDMNNVFRSRARLTLQRPEASEQQRRDTPHIDYRFPHLVIVYYVNTVDGDTLLFDKDTNAILERVSPRRGRCVLFDGSIIHSSTSPSLGPRIIINNNIHR